MWLAALVPLRVSGVGGALAAGRARLGHSSTHAPWSDEEIAHRRGGSDASPQWTRFANFPARKVRQKLDELKAKVVGG